MIEEALGIPILLVEDDQLQSRAMRRVLSEKGRGQYSVTRCSSIAEALAYFEYMKIAAVLLDLELPDSSGLETLTTITSRHPNVPIIILTGTDDEDLAIESLKRGAEDYVVKGQLSGSQLCRTLTHAIERKKTEIEMKKLQNMLQQERRLEALGAIASGIAHEINTPLQFIGTNLEFIKEVFERLEAAIAPVDTIPRTGRLSRDTIKTMRRVTSSLTTDHMTSLRREIPNSLSEAVDGIKRVKKIITAMNVFARTSVPRQTLYDVNTVVRDALTITKHEWKNVATTELYLDEDIPPIPCYPEELSHCLLNLIVNAVHAIQDAQSRDETRKEKGVITISTLRKDGNVEIRIGDSGIGIPQSIQHRIFEPFFTTKAVGRGSGQGLSTVYQMIVRHMNGMISFDSYPNEGTVFKIALPLQANDEKTGETKEEKREPCTQPPT